jgi:hypothetical protein
MAYSLDQAKIRDALPEAYEQFWDTIMGIAVFALDLQMDKTIGSKKRRVGVFGSYKNQGKLILDSISKTVCKYNYVAVTGYGAYVPDQCDKCVSSKEYFPPIVDDLITKFKIPDYVKYHHFPRLMSRAINVLEDVRTQGNEAEGCYHFGIPMIGIVIDSQVGESKGLCNYIVDYNAYQECMCFEKELCLYLALKPKCPFYDYVNVPWATKQLFMTRVNRLVAVKNPTDIDVVVTEYMTNKPTKPTDPFTGSQKSPSG